MYKTEFSVKLENGVKYLVEGNEKIMKAITVKVPCNSVLQDAQIIEAQVRKAEREKIKDSQDMITSMSQEKIEYLKSQATNEEEKEKEPIELINDFIGYGLNLGLCGGALKKILISPFCKALADGAFPFQDAMFDDMSIIDMKKILGEYVKTFLLTSLK